MARRRRYSRVEGVKEMRQLYRGLPEHLRFHIQKVMLDHTERVHDTALLYMRIMVKRRTGTLERNYKRKVYFRKDRIVARVGYIDAKGRKEAWYSRFVHDGTQKAAARPFHDEAVLYWEAKYRKEMRSAVRYIIDEIRWDRTAPARRAALEARLAANDAELAAES